MPPPLVNKVRTVWYVGKPQGRKGLTVLPIQMPERAHSQMDKEKSGGGRSYIWEGGVEPFAHLSKRILW